MKKLMVFMCLAAAMASCETSSELQDLNGPQEIKLSAGVMKMDGETKAAISGTSFVSGTEIGMYGVKNNEDWTSTPYFNNEGTISIVDDAVVFSEKVYYPADDQAVDFYAFYPKATAVEAAGEAPKVAYDLTKQDDILWATVKSGTLTNHVADAALKFGHRLSKINFKVKAGEGFPTTGISVTEIVVTATNTSASLNIGTGVITFSNPGNINAFVADGTDVLAQDITTTVTADAFGDVMIEPAVKYNLKVTAGGVEYAASLTAPNMGQAKTVTLTFLPTGMDIKASITDWETVPGEDADIQK